MHPGEKEARLLSAIEEASAHLERARVALGQISDHTYIGRWAKTRKELTEQRIAAYVRSCLSQHHAP